MLSVIMIQYFQIKNFASVDLKHDEIIIPTFPM